MLSAFTARQLVELKPRDKSKIESLLAYGDRLLVGLNTGSLKIYRVNEQQDDPAVRNVSSTEAETASLSSGQKPVDLLRELDKFSKKPIDQLAIIKEANILICLSDYQVSTYDLQSYTIQEQLTRTKGAGTFAVTSNIVKDSSTGIPTIVSRLAVGVKRRVLIWSWHDSELSSDVQELSLSSTVKTLTWAAGTKILCGMDPGYAMIDIDTNEAMDIMGSGGATATGDQAPRFGGVSSSGLGYIGMGSWVPKPLATSLIDGELLLAKDVNTLFIDSNGRALEKRQIPWAAAPEAISFSYPYILALQNPSKGNLEVRNPETLSLLQSISLPYASVLHVPQPNISLAHAGKGFLVASERSIWRMGALDYDSQITELVVKGRLDEAISLLNLLEDALLRDKQERLREVKMQKAQVLFDQKKYRDSLDLFTDVSAPPERVIKLYPKIVSGELSSEADSPNENGEVNGRNDGEGSIKDNASVNSISSPRKGKSTPAKSTRRHTKKSSIDTASIKSSKKAEINDPAGNTGKENEQANINELDGKDLQAATIELCTFLVGSRTKLQKYLNPDGTLKQASQNGSGVNSSIAFESLLVKAQSTAEDDREQKLRDTAKLVDTTLFRAYMLARPSLAGSLFRIPNFCDPDVVNEKLLERRRYNDLVDFFYGKKLHHEALELLQKFGQANEPDDAAPQLHGPQRIVGYLQNLPPEQINLILEFATWPLTQDPALGMEIFLADSENAETLPRDRVIEYLQKIDQKLAMRYLEHITGELNDGTPEFHQRLMEVYVEQLKLKDNRDDLNEGEAGGSDTHAQLREKFLNFLRVGHYKEGKALNLLPRDDPEFYEARAIVLSNMGNHRQALDIYVFKLKDHNKAEEYCNRIYRSEDSTTTSLESDQRNSREKEDFEPSIYNTLLSLYLAPPPPHKPDWEPALELLSKHGARLPASSTLELMPESLPVADLQSYFQGRIRAANSVVNQTRIEAGLQKIEGRASQAMLLLGDGLPGGNGGRSRKVIVNEDRVCGICHKRLGGSVVIVMPDNSVLHHGCLKRGQNMTNLADASSSSMDGWGRRISDLKGPS